MKQIPIYRMSASGYKRTFGVWLANVRFTPNSGHSEAQERFGLKKQTLDVCLAPNSGRWQVVRRCVRSGRESSGARLGRAQVSRLPAPPLLVLIATDHPWSLQVPIGRLPARIVLPPGKRHHHRVALDQVNVHDRAVRASCGPGRPSARM